MSERTVEEEISAIFRGEAPPEAPVEETETVETDNPAEAVEEETPEAVVADLDTEPEEEKLLAGKYKTVEELERGYQEAQSILGQTSRAELEELRALRDEFSQLRERVEQPQQQAYDPESISEWLEMNPSQIPTVAQAAIEQGNTVLYQQAMGAWSEVDALGAMDFHARMVTAREVQALRAEMAPIQETTQRAEIAQEFADAYTAKKGEHPDFDLVMNSLTQEQIEGFPKSTIAALQQGGTEVKGEVLETLYRWAKAEQAGTLNQAAANAQAAQAAEAAAARVEATVASSTASSDRIAVTKTPNQEWLESFENSPAFRKAAGLA